MANDFREAFIWHLENEGGKLSEIVAATGVSRDILNKLKARRIGTTSVENGMLIAAFYGKSLSDFINLKPAREASRTMALLQMLRPEEQQLLEAQIRGLLSRSATE